MSTVWPCVLVVGAATILFKATGPVLLGRRSLPDWLAGPVAMLAPTVLAALVVTQAVAGHRRIVADARLVGLGAGQPPWRCARRCSSSSPSRRRPPPSFGS